MSASLDGSKRTTMIGGAQVHGSVLYAILLSLAILWPAGLIAAAVTGSGEVLGVAIVTAVVVPMVMAGLASIGWWGGHHKAS